MFWNLDHEKLILAQKVSRAQCLGQYLHICLLSRRNSQVFGNWSQPKMRKLESISGKCSLQTKHTLHLLPNSVTGLFALEITPCHETKRELLKECLLTGVLRTLSLISLVVINRLFWTKVCKFSISSLGVILEKRVPAQILYMLIIREASELKEGQVCDPYNSHLLYVENIKRTNNRNKVQTNYEEKRSVLTNKGIGQSLNYYS